MEWVIQNLQVKPVYHIGYAKPRN